VLCDPQCSTRSYLKSFDNEFGLRDDIERQQAGQKQCECYCWEAGSLIFERGQPHQRRQSAGSHDSGGLEKQQTSGTYHIQGETYEKGKIDKGELLACYHAFQAHGTQ
jgi:hypothetical protein